MKEFPKKKFQSRTDLVVDKITNSIINGELSDGELLPPESKLCELCGVSRSILREAIRALASKGLVEVKQGHGTFVRLPKIEIPEEAVRNYLMTNPFSLQQLLEIRAPIEMEAARLAAERREEKHLGLLEKAMQILKAKSSVEAYADADECFHQAIIDASKNPLFAIMIRSIMVNLHISRQLSIRHFGIAVVVKEHEAILEAIKNMEPVKASTKMKEHMSGFLFRIDEVNKLLKNGELRIRKK
jgi:GntR family transcriptional regulator, transcriptional repressor for pyruvate dehydrogenase complex